MSGSRSPVKEAGSTAVPPRPARNYAGPPIIVTPKQLLYRFLLPQKVRVVQGFMAKREDESLSEGDVM